MKPLWVPLLLLVTPGVLAAPAAALLYEMTEPGVEATPARYLITPEYLRLDDGKDTGDYVLYDRKARVIYNVVHRDRTIGEIHWRPVAQPPPEPLELNEKELPLGAEAPRVGGREVQWRQLYAGERLCMDALVVPGLMPDAVATMAAMQQVLAGEHAAMIPHIPADVRDTCDLAINVYSPGWPLRFGLPIEQQEYNGRRWSLRDFRADVETSAALFTLPPNYRRFNISGLK